MIQARIRMLSLAIWVAWLATVGFQPTALCQAPDGPQGRDLPLEAHRILGRAFYENDRFSEAAAHFRYCLERAPHARDYFNLGLALLRAGEYEESLAMAERALALDPAMRAAQYLRGIAHKRAGRHAEAVESLTRVTKADPTCMEAFYNLGICSKYLGRLEEAIQAFERAAAISPQHPSSHYQLMTLYRRVGRVDDAQRHAESFTATKDNLDASEMTAEALERSRYSYMMIGEAHEEVGPVPNPQAPVRFLDVTREPGAGLNKPDSPAPGRDSPSSQTSKLPGPSDSAASFLEGALAVGDYDGNGAPDIYVVNASSVAPTRVNRLLANDGTGHFRDMTDQAGVADAGEGTDAVFADFDNDGDEDLYVGNNGPNVLYRNRGDGTFEDVSRNARADEPQYAGVVVFADYDHDNDLDLLVGNVAGLPQTEGSAEGRSAPRRPGGFDTLLRNQGDGTFTDRTDEAGLLVERSATIGAIFADFDSDFDVDLFVLCAHAPSRLFLNARLGSLEEGGTFTPPVCQTAHAVAEADLNFDGKPDLLIACDRTLLSYENDGAARFDGRVLAELPATIRDLNVLDYNNDSWPDLLVIVDGESPVVLLAGAGEARFLDVSERVGLTSIGFEVCDAEAEDFDNDGDQDIALLARGRGLVLLKNENPSSANRLRLQLAGKKVNRDGYGAVVEAMAPGFYRRQTARSNVVHFGLGPLPAATVVRVTWPNGVAENVIQPPINETVTVEEHVRVSASCGFLFAFNGQRFELVNEILGIGPLGVPISPGVYHQPDSTELTKIESSQLAPNDGAFELRLSEELRELMFLDAVALRVVDHPQELEIIPNEMFTAPPFPEDKFFAVGDARPPLSAINERGADVLPLVLSRDGRVPEFPRTEFDGLAEPHSLTLDLGDLSSAKHILLFLEGWIRWPESSTVMAIAQNARYAFQPLKLSVRDGHGRWQTAIASVGLPTSKGLVVPVDLTKSFPSTDYTIRLETNLCIYFDRIFTAIDDQSARCRVSELRTEYADLHYRGFSRMRCDRLGFERFDYARVDPSGPWTPPPGRLTRYGDVVELLLSPDDRYVVFGPGDELSLRFPAAELADLPTGWVRDFIFVADGWVKDGDLNTKFSETVDPFPFHNMSAYPYAATESYPSTPEHQQFLDSYLTRIIR